VLTSIDNINQPTEHCAHKQSLTGHAGLYGAHHHKTVQTCHVPCSACTEHFVIGCNQSVLAAWCMPYVSLHRVTSTAVILHAILHACRCYTSAEHGCWESYWECRLEVSLLLALKTGGLPRCGMMPRTWCKLQQ